MQQCCKITKVLREFERAFTKDLSKFVDHETIANCSNAPVYFAHPHSPWERGLMVSFLFPKQNGQRPLSRSRPRLGQYFPKKTKATYTAAYLADCRQKLNTRPRKCLNFASQAQHFSRCLKLLQEGLHL